MGMCRGNESIPAHVKQPDIHLSLKLICDLPSLYIIQLKYGYTHTGESVQTCTVTRKRGRHARGNCLLITWGIVMQDGHCQCIVIFVFVSVRFTSFG